MNQEQASSEPFSDIPPSVDLAQPKFRHDGWSPERQKCFLEALSRTGNVKAAAAYTGLSRESAYRLKRRPDARAFGRAWDAALIHARDIFADDLLDKGLNGWTEDVWHNGEVTGSRQRWSAPLFLAALARLDQLANGLDLAGNPARIAASHFDELVDRIGSGADCEDLLAAQDESDSSRRSNMDRIEGASPYELMTQMMKLREQQQIQQMKPEDIDISDLDIAAMDSWDDLQWERAYCSGFLKRSGVFDDISSEDQEKGRGLEDGNDDPDDRSNRDV